MREGLSWPWLALVLGAFCVPLFIGLGRTDLDNDEAIYSYAVDSILDTGDWLSPRSSPRPDIVFLEKPPLKFWIVAAPIRLGLLPHDEFGLRFWDAVFGSLAFLYVFLIGRRLGGPLCGVVAVLILFAQHRLLFDHGLRSNNMEAALFLTYCGGVYHYLGYLEAGATRRGWHLAAVTALFYLGFMTKFVAALFLPVVLAIFTLAVRAHRRQAFGDWRRWGFAAAAIAAGVLPWFAYQHVATEGDIWRIMFGEHVYARFTAYTDPQHLRPWHFYFTEIFLQLQHSSSTLVVAFGLLVLVARTIRGRVRDGILILVWFAVPLALISAGTSKLYHYAYPFLPPLALAGGYGIAWLVSQAAPAVTGAFARRGVTVPRLSSRAMRGGLLVMASLALGLAVVTAATGQVRLTLAGEVVFRNSSVLRPLILAGICAGLAGRLIATLSVAVALGLALLIPTPLAGYLDNLRELTIRRQPLRRLSECLQTVDAERRAAGESVVGVYGLAPDDEHFLHPYFYYLRRAGGWHPRRHGDDEGLARALFVRGGERPVAVSGKEYAESLERRGITGVLPRGVQLRGIVVLLPGPYGRCAATVPEGMR